MEDAVLNFVHRILADEETSSSSADSSGSGSVAGGGGEVFAGVVIAIVASVGINVGNNMQALGLKMGTTAKDERKSMQEMHEQSRRGSNAPLIKGGESARSPKEGKGDASTNSANGHPETTSTRAEAAAPESAAERRASRRNSRAHRRQHYNPDGPDVPTGEAPPAIDVGSPSPPPSPPHTRVIIAGASPPPSPPAAADPHDYNAPENQPAFHVASPHAITEAVPVAPVLHTRESKADDVIFKAPPELEARLKRAKRLYLIGTVVFFTSTFVVFGAMSLAPASILAPIESVQFVANIAFARIVNKVKLSPAMVIASFVIVGGVGLAVGSGNHVNKSLGPDDLVKYWEDGRWIGYLIGVVIMAGVAQTVWFVYERARKKEKPLPASGTVLPSMYALSSSMIGSISVLQAKCISELLETLGNGVNIWVEGMTWLVLALFATTVGFWLYRLNAALGKYDPLFIIPAIQAGYIFWATLSAGVYFQEFDALEDWQIALFAVGISIMFAGLFVLSDASAKLERQNHPEARTTNQVDPAATEKEADSGLSV